MTFPEISKIIVIIVAAAIIILFGYFCKNDREKEKQLSAKQNLKEHEDEKEDENGRPDDHVNEMLLLQYKTRMQQGIAIAQTEWQVATISVAVTVGVLAAALSYIHNPLFSGLILVGGGALDFGLATAMAKSHLLGRMLQAYSRKVDESHGVAPFPMEANEIARFLMDNDEDYKGKWVNRSLRFFQRRDLAFLLVASILAFALILVGSGLYIMWTWWIP